MGQLNDEHIILFNEGTLLVDMISYAATFSNLTGGKICFLAEVQKGSPILAEILIAETDLQNILHISYEKLLSLEKMGVHPDYRAKNKKHQIKLLAKINK